MATSLRLLSCLPLFALLACGAVHRPVATPPPVALEEYHRAVDWSSAGQEAAEFLSAYLQVDTVNPPGNETRGAEFLAAVLAREGIESEIHEFAPGRGSLVARLPGEGTEPPICLMSHIDVVTSEAGYWPEDKGPLSGVIDEEGVIWGRGALDMKGMGAIELMAMLWIHRLGLPLKRDIVLLAVADEEIGGGGARLIAEEHWDAIGCSHMINEGGFGVRDALFDGQTVFAISIAEKGNVWVRMTAHGEPGHGSTPVPDRAPERLLDAIGKIDAREPVVAFHPALYELFYTIGLQRKGIERAAMTRPLSVRLLLKGMLLDNPATAAMITDTIQLTGLEGAHAPNVVPAEMTAIYDTRLLPGTTPEQMLAELRRLVDHDPNITFEVIQQKEGNGSPWDDPFYLAIARHTAEGRDDAVAGPIVSVGFTDTIFFRALGVNGYGMIPFEITSEELNTMHGHRERVSVENVREGLRRLFAMVVDVSCHPGRQLPSQPVVAPIWRMPEAEAESESETESETEAETESETEAESEAESETESETESDGTPIG